MDTVLQDLRGAFRSLVTQRALTVVIVATLGLGIGASTAIFSLADAVLLRPLPFPEPERLVLVWGERPGSGYAQLPLSLPNANDIRERSRTLEALAVWASFADSKLNLGGAGDPEKVQYGVVSWDLFPLLGVAPVRGRIFSADDDARGRAGGVVISERLWRRLHPDGRGVDGATVTLDGSAVPIVGVLPAGFRFVSFPETPDVWLPLGLDPVQGRPYARGAATLGVLARLAPGATVGSARDELGEIAVGLADEYPMLRGWTLTAVSLRDQTVRGTRPAIVAMLGAGGMVLLIACANVANLLLGRAVARRRELAVRAALGAAAGRIVRQLLTESAVLATLGALLGILLAAWLVEIPAAVAFAPPDIFVPFQVGRDAVGIDWRVLGFAALVVVATTFLVGVIPALRASRADPIESMRGSPAGGDGTRRVRSALVVGEIALSVTLLAAAGLLARSLIRLAAVDPGFRPEQVLAVDVNLPAARYGDPVRSAAFFDVLVARVAAIPGVRAAGAVEQLPFSGPTQSTDFRIIGSAEPAPGAAPRSRYAAATAGYFRAMGIPLVGGRSLEAVDRAGAPRVAVVNEAFARRHFPGENAIGRRFALSVEALRFDRPDAPPRFDFEGAAREIVGIVGDVRQERMAEAPEPMAYISAAQYPVRDMTVTLLAAGDPLALAPAVRGAVASIDPEQPVTAVTTMSGLVTASLGEPRARTALAVIFAALAATLTAIGIYGVIAYGVARRRHELGVRLALGAGRWNVVRLVVAEGVVLALAGAAIGGIGALAAGRALGGMLHEVAPADPVTFAAVIAIVVAMAVGASWVPARRASRVNPAEALRVE